MVLRGVGAIGGSWKRVGYFLARDGRARHVLDARAHADLFVRSAGRDCVRVFDSFHHVPERLAIARCFRFDVGLPRAAGCVHLRVGRGGDDRRGPFDNWWHNSYGLDVKILSPPHVLLALGMLGIRFGTLVLVLAEMNRAEGIYRRRLERILFLTVVFLMA